MCLTSYGKLLKLNKLFNWEVMNTAPSSHSLSVSEKLALYGSTGLSGMEHLNRKSFLIGTIDLGMSRPCQPARDFADP